MFGATSGPYQGNVTALLGCFLAVAMVGLLSYATFEYLHNGRQAAQPFVERGFDVLATAFVAVVALFIGSRAAAGGS